MRIDLSSRWQAASNSSKHEIDEPGVCSQRWWAGAILRAYESWRATRLASSVVTILECGKRENYQKFKSRQELGSTNDSLPGIFPSGPAAIRSKGRHQLQASTEYVWIPSYPHALAGRGTDRRVQPLVPPGVFHRLAHLQWTSPPLDLDNFRWSVHHTLKPLSICSFLTRLHDWPICGRNRA
jgi:hypothetical protein